MFEENLSAKILIALGFIYVAYYLGSRYLKKQPAKQRFFNPEAKRLRKQISKPEFYTQPSIKSLPTSSSDDLRDFAEKVSDKASDLKHETNKSWRKVKRSFLNSGFVNGIQDTVSDLHHEANKSVKHAKRSLTRAFK